MHFSALRLLPGQDLRGALEAALNDQASGTAFVVQGIGSLSVAQLRLAGAQDPTELRGDLEILTLAGSLAPDGAHLHISISDAQGRVLGGHVAAGCIVRSQPRSCWPCCRTMNSVASWMPPVRASANWWCGRAQPNPDGAWGRWCQV